MGPAREVEEAVEGGEESDWVGEVEREEDDGGEEEEAIEEDMAWAGASST